MMMTRKEIDGLEDGWLKNHAMFKTQLDKVVRIIQLGAYSTPKMVIESEKLEMHLFDCLKKDLGDCLDGLRKGNKRIKKCPNLILNQGWFFVLLAW